MITVLHFKDFLSSNQIYGHNKYSGGKKFEQKNFQGKILKKKTNKNWPKELIGGADRPHLMHPKVAALRRS